VAAAIRWHVCNIFGKASHVHERENGLCSYFFQVGVKGPQKGNHFVRWSEMIGWLILSLTSVAQVLPRPELIFPSKTWFFGNLCEFSAAEITSKSIPPTF
jgi:hypothetical protein